MFKLNSKYFISEYDSKFVKACSEDLISTLESNLRTISDNIEYLDESKTSKQETASFIQFMKDEITKIKSPYEHAKENLQSIEFYLKDLNSKVENFLNYNMQAKDESIHGLG